MYRLTLTAEERKAFDWVGDRYATGAKFARLLHWGLPSAASIAEEVQWDDEGEITFLIPERIAWELRELADSEDGRFPCFGPELVAKLEEFLNRIV